MNMLEISELTPEELQQKIDEIKEKMYNLRAQKQLGKLEKPHQLRLMKRDLARLKTAATAVVARSN